MTEGYKHILLSEAKEVSRIHKKMCESPCKSLLYQNKIYYGTIERKSTRPGHIVLTFKRDNAPRLKSLKQMVILKQSLFDDYGKNYHSWHCQLLDIIKPENGYVKKSSEVVPIYFTKGQNNIDYCHVGCSSIKVDTYNFINNYFAQRPNGFLRILVFEPFPPSGYYENLIDYLNYKGTYAPFHNLRKTKDLSEWKPELLSFNKTDKDSIIRPIIKTLRDNKICLLQGPPGTGKTYNVACIVAYYLCNGLSVCATTMANKGLKELILKEPLKEYLDKGKIFKTNISADEKVSAPNLLPIDDSLKISEGELLCSTNFKLSSIIKSTKLNDRPHYDLIIIEEASQAFLSAIAAFSELADHVLIVGDPMQLPPIIVGNDIRYPAWGIESFVHGMELIALESDIKSYCINSSFRLTSNSVALTGIFYNNELKSVKQKQIDFSKISSPYFPDQGGCLYHVTGDMKTEIFSRSAERIMAEVINLLENFYPKKKSLAIITPFQDSVKHLQQSFETDKRKIDLTIETIDRVQGMTVDYTILYLPNTSNMNFALNRNRFNVATSRSESTTLIISDAELLKFSSCKGSVKSFISQCVRI